MPANNYNPIAQGSLRFATATLGYTRQRLRRGKHFSSPPDTCDKSSCACATLLMPLVLLLFAGIFFAPAPARAQGFPPTRPGAEPAEPRAPAPARPAQAPARAPVQAPVFTPAPAPAAKFSKADHVDLAVYGRSHGFTTTWTRMTDSTQLTLRKQGMTLNFTSERTEFLANGTRVHAGSAIRAYQSSLWMSRIDADNLLAPIAAPASIRHPIPSLRVIAIDAGHGGNDHGTINPRLRTSEKNHAHDTAARLKILLERNGYKVVLIRPDDKFVERVHRPEIARLHKADLFVSIHYNAIESPHDAQRISGVEVYRFTPRHQPPLHRARVEPADKMANSADAAGHWSSLAAFQVHRALLANLRVPDRGLKHNKFDVLRLATMPAILVEPGFLTNDAEARKIMTPAYRQRIAESIATGIQAYADALDALRVQQRRR